FGFRCPGNGKETYFNAPGGGTTQLFSVEFNPANTRNKPKIRQITNGEWDVAGLVGQVGNEFFITRTDMNHAAEIYSVDLKSGNMSQITHVNNDIYDRIKLSKIERRIVKTTDNKDMVTWVIYP